MRARYNTPPASLATASRHYRPRLKFVQGDASLLPETFGAGVIDMILDKGTIHSILLLRGGTQLCSQVRASAPCAPLLLLFIAHAT